MCFTYSLTFVIRCVTEIFKTTKNGTKYHRSCVAVNHATRRKVHRTSYNDNRTQEMMVVTVGGMCVDCDSVVDGTSR